MPTTYKILGQAEPADTNDVDLYTVPASTETIVSTIVIANTSANEQVFRIFIREAGAASSRGNAIAYDTAINGNTQVAFTLGLTLSATDIISVRTNAGNTITFQAFGSEIS